MDMLIIQGICTEWDSQAFPLNNNNNKTTKVTCHRLHGWDSMLNEISSCGILFILSISGRQIHRKQNDVCQSLGEEEMRSLFTECGLWLCKMKGSRDVSQCEHTCATKLCVSNIRLYIYLLLSCIWRQDLATQHGLAWNV